MDNSNIGFIQMMNKFAKLVVERSGITKGPTFVGLKNLDDSPLGKSLAEIKEHYANAPSVSDFLGLNNKPSFEEALTAVKQSHHKICDPNKKVVPMCNQGCRSFVPTEKEYDICKEIENKISSFPSKFETKQKCKECSPKDELIASINKKLYVVKVLMFIQIVIVVVSFLWK